MHLPLKRRYQGACLLFFLSLCMVFVWLGTGSLYWKRMACPVVLGAFCLWFAEPRLSLREIPGTVWVPLLLAAYTALSPGAPGADRIIGLEILLAYLSGVGAVLFAREHYWKSLTCFPLVLTLALAGYFAGVFSKPLTTTDDRLTLFLKYPNILASVSACAIIFLVTFRKHFSGKLRVPGIMLFAACLASMLMTAGRSAYLGLFVCMLFWMIMLLRKHIVRMAGILAVVAVALPFTLPDNQIERIQSAVFAPFSDRTFQTRLPIWEITAAGIQEAPWLGHSITAFKGYHGAYMAQHAEELQQKYPEVEPVVFHPHNLALGLLFMYGITGTALFAWSFTPATLRAIRENDLFFLSTLLFYGVYGALEFTLDREDGILLLFFPLGLVYGRAILEAQGKTPAHHKQCESCRP